MQKSRKGIKGRGALAGKRRDGDRKEKRKGCTKGEKILNKKFITKTMKDGARRIIKKKAQRGQKPSKKNKKRVSKGGGPKEKNPCREKIRTRVRNDILK